MAAEVPVSLLWGKLQKMRDEETFVFPGLRNRVVTAVNELEKILCFLKASKPNHEIISTSPQETSFQRTGSSSTPQEASLLRAIYSAEHFTESFLLQRIRKGVSKIEKKLAFSPWTQLWFSFKMMKLVQGNESNSNLHRTLSNLHLFGEISKEDHISNVPGNLRTLTLSMSGLEEDPMPVLGKLLPQLNTLRLFARSYVGSKMTCPSAHFPKLRVLKMWNLERLEQWEVEQGAMPQLEELEIRCCEKLESSVELEKLDYSLKELILTNMPQDFVEDIRTRMGRGILLTNKWEFSTSHVKHDTNTSKEERRMEDSGS